MTDESTTPEVDEMIDGEDGQSEEEITAIGMIADALHYCADNGVEFEQALDSARQGFHN